MESAVRIFTPGEAAKELGVTTQSLRRYAEAYGDVFNEIPQHAGQRVFDDLFVTRLQAAQVLQHANKAPSIRAALEIVRDTSEAGDVLAEVTQPPFEQLVLERLETLAQMVMQLQEENRALREGLRQLEAPKDDTRERELEVANAELRQRNEAMLQELERRTLQAEGKDRPKPWWRFW